MNLEKFQPVITDAALPYLVIQQGRISRLAKGPAAWRAAYRKQLVETFEAVSRFLPQPLTSVVDIGGGMGGFDALLNFVHPGLDVSIVDGMKDGAEVRQPDQTYSSYAAADEFLRENGVREPRFIDPRWAVERGPEMLPDGVDLVLSLQSWCFHYPPQVYMNFALGCSRPGTVWILDVRIMQRFWASDLFSQERLEPIGEAPGFTDKYTRMAFRVSK